jgi:hypothetical protein
LAGAINKKRSKPFAGQHLKNQLFKLETFDRVTTVDKAIYLVHIWGKYPLMRYNINQIFLEKGCSKYIPQ